jgi:hypothetical protein
MITNWFFMSDDVLHRYRWCSLFSFDASYNLGDEITYLETTDFRNTRRYQGNSSLQDNSFTIEEDVNNTFTVTPTMSGVVGNEYFLQYFGEQLFCYNVVVCDGGRHLVQNS